MNKKGDVINLPRLSRRKGGGNQKKREKKGVPHNFLHLGPS